MALSYSNINHKYEPFQPIADERKKQKAEKEKSQ